MIPPYVGVKLVEYHDHIALTPVTWRREFVGLGNIKAKDLDPQIGDGEQSLSNLVGSETELWVIVQWERFEDGSEKPINIQYIAGATEAEAHEALERMRSFMAMTKQELEELGRCFEVPKEDRDYIANRFPENPDDLKSPQEHDLYQARLKVLMGMQPKTVALIEEANATSDPAKRAQIEFRAVSAYYAEMAHYWSKDVLLAWQRTNPIAAEWICEFTRVLYEPKREVHSVDHEIVLNWMRRGYNLLTAQELSDAIYKETGERLTPEALKKRRERLGLTTDRSPGPRPNSER